MKTPTAKKLPSGSWYCRVRINGQDVSVTKPTEKEALAEAMALKAGIKEAEKTEGKNKTVTKAIDDYISIRQNILSPSTIRGYRGIQRNYYQSVMHQKIGSIPESRWRSLTNLEAQKYSAKSLKNAWGFMSSVICESTGKRIEVNLPQQIPAQTDWLDPDQIPVFLKAIKGTREEIPALLALSSLRRSEIFALRWENIDLDKKLLYIRGAAVIDENQKFVQKKENKNHSSRREVPIIAPLLSALQAVEVKEGYVFKDNPNALCPRINKHCQKAGLPPVGVHGLRHSFASLSYHRQIPEAATMEIGGWADPGTMRKIYTHISKKDREGYGAAFTSFFEEQNDDENDDGNKKAQ